MKITAETTPNPHSMRILVEDVAPHAFQDCVFVESSKQAQRSDFAKQLFDVLGVDSVLFGPDFFTINKHEQAAWSEVLERVNALASQIECEWSDVLRDFVKPASQVQSNDPLEQKILAVLDEQIRPNVQQDGGDVEFCSFDSQSGVLTIRLIGACVGCPYSTITLRQGIESTMKFYVPEVQRIVQEGAEDLTDEETVYW